MTALLSRQRSKRWWALGATTAITAVFAVFFVAASGAIVTGSPSNFESGDGNLVVDTTGYADWNSKVGAGAVVVTDPSGSAADNSWVNGQKMDSACAQLANNKNPGKDDFTHVATYNETSAGHVFYLYGATIRLTANGSASENVELNKVAGTAACPITRTAGDKLLAFDYLNGGTNLDLNVLTWVVSGPCIVSHDTAPCWSATVVRPNPATFEGETNALAITAANNKISNAGLVAGQFAEFGVNLTAALNLSTTSCTTFAQTTWESRSSGSSFSSNPEDIVIEGGTVSNCGEIKIIKHTIPTTDNQSFPFTSTIAGHTSFSLNPSTGDNLDVTDVFAGSYTVTEGADPANYGFVSVGCTASTGSSGAQSGTTKTVNITVAAGGTVTCTYVNQKLTGAIRVTKTSGKAAGGLNGAVFSVVNSANASAGTLTTITNGTDCLGGLPLGTYTVTETTPPAGYAIDDQDPNTAGVQVSKPVDVTAGTCTTGAVAVSFSDTPLTKIQILVTSLGKKADGTTDATASNIACTNTDSSVLSADTENGAADPAYDDTNETYGGATGTGLKPGTYTCTIVVDP